MPSMPIDWHKRNLTNMQASLERARGEVRNAQARAALIQEQVDYAQGQIDRAAAEGKDRYDNDRYLPRKK